MISLTTDGGCLLNYPTGCASNWIVGRSDTAELILSWCRGFRADELTVEDIQERFAVLDVSGTDLPRPIQERVVEAQRLLDAIRWGMCETGQRAEVERIFAELELLLDPHKPGEEIPSPRER